MKEEKATLNERLMKHGALGWSELMTTDLGAVRPLYGALFGWETWGDPVGGMDYVWVKVGAEAVGGRMARAPECAGGPPAWGVCGTV